MMHLQGRVGRVRGRPVGRKTESLPFIQTTLNPVYSHLTKAHRFMPASIGRPLNINMQNADNKTLAALFRRRGGVCPHPRSCGVSL